MPQGEQDMPDSMGSVPGHLPDVTNPGTGARSRSQQHLLVKTSPAAEKSWIDSEFDYEFEKWWRAGAKEAICHR